MFPKRTGKCGGRFTQGHPHDHGGKDWSDVGATRKDSQEPSEVRKRKILFSKAIKESTALSIP